MIQFDAFIFVVLFFSGLLFERIGIIQEANRIKNITVNNFRIMADKRISDHWKEKYLRKISIRTFLFSLRLIMRIALFLACVLLPFALLHLVSPETGIFDYLITTRGIIVSIVPFIAYFVIRKLIRN